MRQYYHVHCTSEVMGPGRVKLAAKEKRYLRRNVTWRPVVEMQKPWSYARGATSYVVDGEEKRVKGHCHICYLVPLPSQYLFFLFWTSRATFIFFLGGQSDRPCWKWSLPYTSSDQFWWSRISAAHPNTAYCESYCFSVKQKSASTCLVPLLSPSFCLKWNHLLPEAEHWHCGWKTENAMLSMAEQKDGESWCHSRADILILIF